MTALLSQMERLIGVLEGRWKCQVTYEPNPGMPGGGTSVGSEECRVGPGRWSIFFDTHAEGETGTFEGAGLITWNAKNDGYDLRWLTTSSPEPGMFAGRWEDGDVVFDGHEYLAGQRFASRHSITEINPDAFVYTVELGPVPDALMRTATIRYTRCP
ncbi:hypothetical protein [Mycolicibacterium sp. XJ870]